MKMQNKPVEATARSRQIESESCAPPPHLKRSAKMKSPANSILAILIAPIIAGTCLASTDCTCLIYQPIDMRSEGTVIKLAEDGYIILPIPYLSGFSVPEKPYGAITRPHTMLSMRRNQGAWDSNLVSRTGIKIHSDCTYAGAELKEEVVTVDFSAFKATDHDPSLEVIAEATLECIRRTATDEHQNWPRPVLKIIGKPKDEEKWKPWIDAFNKQDFFKPFKRPQAPKKEAEAADGKVPDAPQPPTN